MNFFWPIKKKNSLEPNNSHLNNEHFYINPIAKQGNKQGFIKTKKVKIISNFILVHYSYK